MPELDAVIKAKPVETSVDFGLDAVIVFSFDANKVTPRWFNEMRKRLQEEDDVLSVAKAIAELIESWNLTANGEQIPPSVETLSQFPLGHLNQLMDAIAEVPTRAEGEASSALPQAPSTDSSQQAPSPQNGAATSESLKSSESLSPT